MSYTKGEWKIEKCKCEDKNTDYHLLNCCKKMKLWIKIYLWINKNHKWHKDWQGCLICELRLKNNLDKPITIQEE